VLSVYPSEKSALHIAGKLLKVNQKTSYRNASKEPLTPTEIHDPRVNGLFCACDAPGCGAEWISAKVLEPDFGPVEVVNPIGGQCTKCGRYFCRHHFSAAGACPQCGIVLDYAPPPNGRSSGQTVRLNKPLVHVFVLKEGIAPPGSFLTELFQSVVPDFFEDSATVGCIPTGNKWPETPVDLAWALLARDHREYLAEAYDVRPVELRKDDGTRMVILKVFANRPKIVDPTASARQPKVVAAPASAQQTNSVEAPASAQRKTMEYFQTPQPGDGDGVCSDRQCPCGGTRIPRGEGYLHISIDCCGFRWDCRTPGEMESKIERLSKEIGTRIHLAPDLTMPILLCETGARRHQLDLEIAARDATHWWATEQVPFRPTPRLGERKYAFEGRASPPGGSLSSQPVRPGKRLVHVLVFKEGNPASGDLIKEFFDSLTPEEREDSPTVGGRHTGNTFYAPLEDVAMALLAKDNGEYLNDDYDVCAVEFRQTDGTRVVMLKVFADHPKIADPKAPSQQTNRVDVPAWKQKKNSGWRSKFRRFIGIGAG
jgi:hypothetical protein